MALLNKLFSTRTKFTSKLQENVCDKMFSLGADQVRLVLFCECDFRGRKLLFDSHAVQKVALPEMSASKPTSSSTGSMNSLTDISKDTKKYTEISEGHGYIYTKPNADIYQLGEMIFGSVAMSYRGTTYKIHHMNTPTRIMCTQVFPSPRQATRLARQQRRHGSIAHCASAPTTSDLCTSRSSDLEQSVRLRRDDDSGASVGASSCDGCTLPPSSASDTLLFCRSTPLSAPQNLTQSDHRHSIGDSGLTNSYASFGNASTQSMPLNFNQTNPYLTTFSNGSLYRRWLRSASTSLERSSGSLPGSMSGDNVRSKQVGWNRSSKLGMAIIISLPLGQEGIMERFLMEHAALVEAMVWRARVATEAAYFRRRHFVASLYSTAASTVMWLSDLLTYSLGNNTSLPQQMTAYRSHMYTINSSNGKLLLRTNSDIITCGDETLVRSSDSVSGSAGGGYSNCASIGGVAFAGLSRLWRTDWDFMRHKSGAPVNGAVGAGSSASTAAERCVRDLCELLESIDVKDTNFFVSTLITAVLTHHLGWVATAMPVSPDEQEAISQLRNPGNPLWGQLTDLYGAIGCPTKIAHTIITGAGTISSVVASVHSSSANHQSDIITKLLNSITYFIRCCDVKRKCVSRGDVLAENQVAEDLCQRAGCIPKENYKKYADHLQEMHDYSLLTPTDLPKVDHPIIHKTTTLSGGMKKSFSCLTALDRFGETTCDTNASYSHLKSDIDNVFSQTRTHSDKDDIQNVLSEPKESDQVVFVLGESDELVGLKSQHNRIVEEPECGEDTFPFKESDFSSIRPGSTSLKTSRSQADLNKLEAASSSDSRKKLPPRDFVRAQSVPPELPEEPEKITIDKTTPKYKYSGVKFNFQQYPQIVANYMRSKNIELSNLQFLEKAQLAPSVFTAYDFTKYEVADDFELDTLQTPSNATDLEFTADQDDGIGTGHKEGKTDRSDGSGSAITHNILLNGTVKNGVKCKGGPNCREIDETRDNGAVGAGRMLKIVELPLPKSVDVSPDSLCALPPVGFTHTLLQARVRDHYVADLVLQGTSAPRAHWEAALRQDLATATQHPLLDQPIDEAIAIIANIDTWEVQLMSSHTYVVEKGSTGVTIGMSQLVANMLESLLHLWKLQMPAEYCLMHIEEKLQEFCVRSKALAELLLATEFCSMEVLTSALQLEVNDIPLLMSIASTHSPHVMQKYGLSFQ